LTVSAWLDVPAPTTLGVCTESDDVALGLGDGRVVVVDYERAQARLSSTTFSVGSGAVTAIAFAPEAGLLGAACGCDVVLSHKSTSWMPESDPAVKATAAVAAVAWSARGDRIATAGADGVLVLSRRTGAAILRLRVASASSIAFVASDESLAVGAVDGTLGLYELDTGALRRMMGPSDSSLSGPVVGLSRLGTGGDIGWITQAGELAVLKPTGEIQRATLIDPIGKGTCRGVTSLSTDPNSDRLAITTYDGHIIIESKTGALARSYVLRRPPGFESLVVRGAGFLRKGELACACADFAGHCQLQVLTEDR
jgi:WD40 repeat protein